MKASRQRLGYTHTRGDGLHKSRDKGFTFYQTLKAIHKYNARKRYEWMFGNEVYNWSDLKIDHMGWDIWRPDLARQHEST